MVMKVYPNSFNDYTFANKCVPPPDDQWWKYRGWLQTTLMMRDDPTGRWDYLARTVANRGLIDDPIPQVEFNAAPEVAKIIERHLAILRRHGLWNAFKLYVDYLAYGLSLIEALPIGVSEDEGSALFDCLMTGDELVAFLESPYDYLGEYVASNFGDGWNPNAFYPTPMNLCQFIVDMQMATAPPGKDKRLMSVLDPCVGSGRLLLAASNHSMRLYGQDIDPLMVKLTMINGMFYAPWIVLPPFGRDEEEAP